ncbi:aminotransferase class I/II-fold pyridoxal phosphate-dependent enzyme [Bailinhaonella thermotolerans]|uniref:Aminotransferase n=1 Tax=Bailinhaonella thermotolerans TaxID=1070861 RepID=A0A3A4ALH4_9ACTN|nr:aminotransferase class I/II-fold pyridoxal phosphate-dependent enzyme [Bailinhaonella thermotolerans]
MYARELGQHAVNEDERLTDGLDGRNVYLVATRDGRRCGFVSVTPPWAGDYSIDKYLRRADHPELAGDDLFEIRILTVDPAERGTAVAALLMYAALRWTAAHGGRRLVAMGRTGILSMYLAAGLTATGTRIRSGAVTYEVLTGDVRDLTERTSRRYGGLLRRLEPGLRWGLETPFLDGTDGCEHGGASIGALGRRFETLAAHGEVVPADVLDAWFPPAPGVVAALDGNLDWVARTSPPADAGGLTEAVAADRGLPEESLALGAGSSDLIFRAFRQWLTPSSRVLLVDPSYGEYAHVTERVVGCRPDRFTLRREEGWRVDPDRLRDALREPYDLVVIVNPNNPTGVHLDSGDLRAVLDDAPGETRFWIDEAYVGYAGLGRSLGRHAASSENVVVCTSLSKMYALSGLRAAYLAGPPDLAAELRRWTPPWAVSLPAQIAAARALGDPRYYAARWAETGDLRAGLAAGLASHGLDVRESVANFVLLTLPPGGPSASALVRECRKRGVYLRDLSALSPAFEGRTVRVAVRDAAANARIVSAVAASLRDLGWAGPEYATSGHAAGSGRNGLT